MLEGVVGLLFSEKLNEAQESGAQAAANVVKSRQFSLVIPLECTV